MRRVVMIVSYEGQERIKDLVLVGPKLLLQAVYEGEVNTSSKR